MSNVSALPLLAGVAGLALLAPAHAADAPPIEAATPGYIVTLGGAAEFSPRFTGARRYGFSPAPSFDIRRSDEPEGFSAPNDGLDYALFETSRFEFGPVANIRWGRTRSDMPNAMRGIGTTPTVPELGAFADVWLAPDLLRTRIEVRHGVRSNDGVVADLSADLVDRFGPVTLSGGPRMAAASSGVMSRTFGVKIFLKCFYIT